MGANAYKTVAVSGRFMYSATCICFSKVVYSCGLWTHAGFASFYLRVASVSLCLVTCMLVVVVVVVVAVVVVAAAAVTVVSSSSNKIKFA